MKKLVSLMLIVVLLTSFYTPTAADTLMFPAQLTIIDDEAFEGDTSIDEVVLPDGMKAISSLAFANSSLKSIFIPDSVDFIADDAFLNCESLTIFGNCGSYAQTYAKKFDIPFFGDDGSVLHSSHPYHNNSDISWEYVHPQNADYLKVSFSEDTEMEGNYDYLYITDADGVQTE